MITIYYHIKLQRRGSFVEWEIFYKSWEPIGEYGESGTQKALAEDLAGVGHNHKGVGVNLLEMAAEQHRLAPGEDGEHHVVGLMSVGPLGLPDGGAPLERIGHIGAYVLGAVGDHEKGLDVLYDTIAFLENSRASAIEVGIPWSDPVADGPVIELAGQRSLANDVSLTAIVQKLQERFSYTL